jgi:glycosyltransferase involved in cell wall biosynthesis
LIFLTRYAGKVIQQSCGPLHSIAYFPHCVDAAFKQARQLNNWQEVVKRHIRCLYV